MFARKKFSIRPDQFLPSWRAALQAQGLKTELLSVAAPMVQARDRLQIPDRHRVLVSDGHKIADWRVESLQELFRGQEAPPPAVADLAGTIPTDAQFEDWYSNLRRRPDGRSLGPFPDYLWQVAAVMLGVFPLRGAQFDGVFGALALSAARWRIGYSCRNYVESLRSSLA